MFTLTEIFTILSIHYVADFIFQTDKEAKGKSKNLDDLLSHTFTYSEIWFSVGVLVLAYKSNLFTNLDFYKPYSLLLFSLITFICHTITDYFTSRLNSYLWNKGDVHNFFVSLGFDQLLHYIQLFLTYYYLFK